MAARWRRDKGERRGDGSRADWREARPIAMGEGRDRGVKESQSAVEGQGAGKRRGGNEQVGGTKARRGLPLERAVERRAAVANRRTGRGRSTEKTGGGRGRSYVMTG
ncbi:hypothetical protein chiPu_0024997 [Chiloscyllium punctatum]|uniref:Uncharacterized protein n=1 Tax=Chiloscyllium punctatum TaxID=137246 RepID=A0A401TF07_CHIPU|nr:hypothetical protein [Chiloscyllium punctatum]